MQRTASILVLAFAMFALQACATPDYAKPVAGFASAVDAANKQLEISQAAIEQRRLEKARAYALAHPRAVKPASDDDCNPGVAKDVTKNRCRLVVRYEGGGEEPLSYSDSRLDVRALSAPLAEYSNNLAKIVETDVAADVASAVSGAKAQVDKLGASIEAYNKQQGNDHSQVGARVAAASTPIAAFLEHGLTLYLENMKLEALRAATQEMDPVVNKAAAVLASVGKTEASSKQVALQKEYEKTDEDHQTAAQGGASAEERARALDAWIGAAKALDASKQAYAGAGAVYAALSKAHNDLTILLRDGDANSVSFWTQIDAALDEIGKLADIAQQFKDAQNATSDEDEKKAAKKAAKKAKKGK